MKNPRNGGMANARDGASETEQNGASMIRGLSRYDASSGDKQMSLRRVLATADGGPNDHAGLREGPLLILPHSPPLSALRDMRQCAQSSFNSNVDNRAT
jgi:hypothetical protein